MRPSPNLLALGAAAQPSRRQYLFAGGYPGFHGPVHVGGITQRAGGSDIEFQRARPIPFGQIVTAARHRLPVGNEALQSSPGSCHTFGRQFARIQ